MVGVCFPSFHFVLFLRRLLLPPPRRTRRTHHERKWVEKERGGGGGRQRCGVPIADVSPFSPFLFFRSSPPPRGKEATHEGRRRPSSPTRVRGSTEETKWTSNTATKMEDHRRCGGMRKRTIPKTKMKHKTMLPPAEGGSFARNSKRSRIPHAFVKHPSRRKKRAGSVVGRGRRSEKANAPPPPPLLSWPSLPFHRHAAATTTCVPSPKRKTRRTRGRGWGSSDPLEAVRHHTPPQKRKKKKRIRQRPACGGPPPPSPPPLLARATFFWGWRGAPLGGWGAVHEWYTRLHAASWHKKSTKTTPKRRTKYDADKRLPRAIKNTSGWTRHHTNPPRPHHHTASTTERCRSRRVRCGEAETAKNGAKAGRRAGPPCGRLPIEVASLFLCLLLRSHPLQRESATAVGPEKSIEWTPRGRCAQEGRRGEWSWSSWSSSCGCFFRVVRYQRRIPADANHWNVTDATQTEKKPSPDPPPSPPPDGATASALHGDGATTPSSTTAPRSILPVGAWDERTTTTEQS